MNLDQFIADPPTGYNGRYVRGGQCGELVRQYWIDVDKTNPPSYENSKDYWYNPVPGYVKSQNPVRGAIAIYDGHGAFPEGHSAIYVDGRVFEQNADPDGSPAHLYNRKNTYLLGYLIKEGTDNMWSMTKEQVDAMVRGFTWDYPGIDFDYNKYLGQPASQVLLDQLITELAPYAEKKMVEYATLQKQVSAGSSSFVPLGQEVFVKAKK